MGQHKTESADERENDSAADPLIWRESLLLEAEKVVSHGYGELKMTVVERGGKVSVRITGGKTVEFIIDE